MFELTLNSFMQSCSSHLVFELELNILAQECKIFCEC